MGYLPHALCNYLARLGWSHGDDEVMSIDDMISWFEVQDINKGAARFDFKKLEALNGIHMRQMDDTELLDALVETLPYLENADALVNGMTEERRAQLLKAMPGLKERAKTLVELADSLSFLFAMRPLRLDEKAAEILGSEARALLGGLLPKLSAAAAWNTETLEQIVRDYAEQTGLKLGKVAQPLRAALTGRATSPGVFDVLDVLGREESLARIGDQASS